MTGERVCPLSTREITDRVLLFTEEIADVKLYTYQSLFCRRIVESIIGGEGAIITALYARQSGKSESIASVALGLGILLPALHKTFPDDPRLKPFRKGVWTGIYAPIQEQSDISFKRVSEKVHSDKGLAILADPEFGLEIITDQAETVVFSNGSIIAARTASPTTKLEGRTWHLIILEESQDIMRVKVEKEIEPMGSATAATMVKVGTAGRSRGGFHTSIQANIDAHAKGGPRNHFEFNWTIIAAEKRRAFERDGNPFHLNYEKTVSAKLASLGGVESDEFKMNYGCKWMESRIIAVSDETMKRAEVPALESGPAHRGAQVAGLDIGKVNDSTILTTIVVDTENPVINRVYLPESDVDKQKYYPKTIIDWVELGGAFEGSSGQYARLVDYLQQTAIKVLVIDATAIGDPVFERIEAMVGGSIVCVPYKFTSVSKSLLYKYYLQELNSGRVAYAAGPRTKERFEFRKFVQEHLDLDRKEVGGYTICEAPDGSHDDYPDSAALACWGEKILEQVRMPEIVVASASTGGRKRGWGNQMGESDDIVVANSTGRGGRYARRW